MTDIKSMIDKDLGSYAFTRTADELFSMLDERQGRVKKTSLMLSLFCVVLVAAFLSGNFLMANRSAISVKAFALEIDGDNCTDKPSLLSNSKGVQKLSKKVYYDSNGREIANGKKSGTSFKRCVIVPSPLSVEIVGEDIKSVTVNCSSNGALYNSKGDDIRGISMTSAKDINWQPNCEKLMKALGKDKIPSTLKKDRESTAKLKKLLVTAEDYNSFFGGSIYVCVVHNDGAVENLTAVITLDENGQYYISKSE